MFIIIGDNCYIYCPCARGIRRDSTITTETSTKPLFRAFSSVTILHINRPVCTTWFDENIPAERIVKVKGGVRRRVTAGSTTIIGAGV